MKESAPHQPSKEDQPKPERLKADPQSTERMNFMFALVAKEGMKKAMEGGGK